MSFSLTVLFVYYLRRRRLCFHFGLFVCLSVCPSDNWKSCDRNLTKFIGGVGHGPGTNEFNFGDDLDHHPDPGVRSPKSAFTGLSKKLPTGFDEILCRAGVWPRDQLITKARGCIVSNRIGMKFSSTIPLLNMHPLVESDSWYDVIIARNAYKRKLEETETETSARRS